MASTSASSIQKSINDDDVLSLSPPHGRDYALLDLLSTHNSTASTSAPPVQNTINDDDVVLSLSPPHGRDNVLLDVLSTHNSTASTSAPPVQNNDDDEDDDDLVLLDLLSTLNSTATTSAPPVQNPLSTPSSTHLMASTSTSSVQKHFKYDVFLSFRGEDTRKTFVDHLYHALHDRGIITYKDDERIEKGERISDQLIKSIEESRFYIIVFSRNYASSSWCLEELVHIMECQKMTEHTAYPIFYDVEPTEIRNQSGSVREALKKRKRTLEDVDDLEKEDDVGRWRNALKEAADLAGMELKNTFNGHEAKFIQQIVEMVSLKLNFFNSSADGKLVGMEIRVKKIVSSLELGSDDVRVIGIKGMGGAGKTTLARTVFDHISVCFEGKSFVENVREGSKGYGLNELQKKVLQDVLNDKNIDVESVYDGKNMMKKMMCNTKVLVVLDDVDDTEQLEALAGDRNWFKLGSRIIITTRDEQVLVANRANFIHDVSLLSSDEAICLFSRYAFERETPKQGYEKLSGKVVRYAAGLPLTVKVLGSHLCGRSESEWKDVIERLKIIPLKKTLEKLELSYNGLENDEKEIFLDVVCMLKGKRKGDAIKILQSCGFNAHIGLRVLEQKSLITVSDSNCLGFHDHIEEMGRNIVRRLHPDEPSRHSRLWIKEEIEDIFVNELGTEDIKCIELDYSNLNPSIIMKGLRKMKELRVLYLNQGYHTHKVDEANHYLPHALRFLRKMKGLRFLYLVQGHRKHKVDEVIKYLPDALCSLCWHGYPFRCLPKTFQATKLVTLQMSNSNITKLWEGREKKVLNNLKFLDLCGSKLRMLDLGMTPNLEELNLDVCNELVELHMPYEFPNLKYLNLDNSRVSSLNLGLTPNLERLYFKGCDCLQEIHSLVGCLKKLVILNLDGYPFCWLPKTFQANKLVKLEMRWSSITQLWEGGETKVLNNLKFLDLSYSELRVFDLRMTPHLEELNLEGCKEFVELHVPFESPNLKYLNLTGSKVSSFNLGLTPNLERLHLERCDCLQEIHAPVGCLKKLVFLNLDCCSRFNFFRIKKHGSAGLDSIATFEVNVEFVVECPLHPNNKFLEFNFECKYDEVGSSWSGNIEKLISFGPCTCAYLEYLSATVCGLQHLRELTLGNSNIPEVPKDLWQLESLEKLTLCMNKILHLPDSICMLKHLKHLELNCTRLEQLPENICRLECLEELVIMFCKSMGDIRNDICKMKCLKVLDLSYC